MFKDDAQKIDTCEHGERTWDIGVGNALER